MPKKVVSGAQAVAEAVKLCEPDVIAAYPITPQTLISEALADMVANGELNSEYIRVESEQSAMAACIGASATGARTYTASASQGLALMHEMLFSAAGLRLPIVMAVANRALNSPLNIWNDQQDSFSQRDTGWIQLYVENAQEAFDTQVQAFKLAEQLSLPVMVCLDGYVISHTYEPVEFLDKEKVKRFLPPFKPEVSLNPSKPVTIGSVASPEYYIEFKKQQQDAMEKAREAIKSVNREYASISGRAYGNGLVETAGLEDKDCAIITIGSVAGTVRELMKTEKIGLIRVRSLRPFPAAELREKCKNLKAAAVLEKDISFGANGALYDEVKSALYTAGSRPKVSGFIAGLGGRDITLKDIQKIVEKLKAGFDGVEWIM